MPQLQPTTIDIVYFAWVRERIGAAREQVSTTAATPRALLAELSSRDDRHAAAFSDLRALRVALDQNLADLDASLEGVRELAVFPPMTGG